MEVTGIALQTVAAGEDVAFTETAVNGTKCIVHRQGSGIIKLRGITNQCKGNSKYVKETCYDSIEKQNTDDPDAEIREMLKAEEAWAAESRKSHLPKPKIV